MIGFERAVEEHQRSVFSFARYLLGSRQEAEDVTQEALLRMWRHWETLDADRLEAWLLKVTRNLCYDSLRRLRASRRHVVDTADEEAVERVPTADRDPEETAHAGSLREQVVAAMENLREPYQSAVVLRELEGLTYREIADVLETPLNSVKVHVHRGRRMLREMLDRRSINVASA